MAHRLTSRTLDTEEALVAVIGEPTELVLAKLSNRLNTLTRPFVELSPFVCVATTDGEGRCDVSPRGDPPGFVKILDDVTLLVPERPGNRIADTLKNVLQNPRVGLLFFLPGVGDTFRVNGRATLTTDQSVLAPCEMEGKIPKLGMIVDVEEAYTQCSKAFIRSGLWDPSRHIDRKALPTNGNILKAIQGETFDADGYDAERAARYARREGFY